MPDRDVKTIRDLIYYQYAALRRKVEQSITDKKSPCREQQG
jgi:hypothetical protein